MNKRKTIEEYDALRLIVTILVVLSHSGYYVIRSDYGGCDYGELASDRGVVYSSFMIIATELFGSAIFQDNLCAILFLSARFLLTLMISLLITLSMKKINIKYVV